MNKYKIAEIFHSIQGECSYQGAPFCFIRLAGCNVGKYGSNPDEKLNALRVLHPEYSICTSALGQQFQCDTDYRGTETLDENEIIDRIGDAPIVCFTGGEPLIWELQSLINKIWELNKKVHIETSGTIRIKYDLDWIACAPKEGFLPENLSRVNEWKFIVDSSMGNPDDVANRIADFIKYANSHLVYIMPVNGIDAIDKVNVDYAYEIVKAGLPLHLWRVGFQAHKIAGYR